jgi:hypothetical protein
MINTLKPYKSYKEHISLLYFLESSFTLRKQNLHVSYMTYMVI